jgi:hypothetical protein
MLKGDTQGGKNRQQFNTKLGWCRIKVQIQFHTLLVHDVNFSCHIGHYYGLDFEQIGAISPMFGELYKKL